jgi:hypothetical protein
MNDLLIFSFFILDIYMGVCIESTTDDDCKRLRDATDLKRKKRCHVYVRKMLSSLWCLLREQGKSLSFPFFFYLSLDCLWSWAARAHVYNKQDSMYVSKMCVWREREKKKKRNFLSVFFLYRDRMLMMEGKMDCVCERKKIYLSVESRSCNETTTIDDRSIGNSTFLTVLWTWFYLGNTWVTFISNKSIDKTVRFISLFDLNTKKHFFPSLSFN